MNIISTPDKIYAELFTDVQLSGIFPDSKTFVDCIPKRRPADILRDYRALKSSALDLQEFITSNFEIPAHTASDYKTNSNEDIIAHINRLWKVLRREGDKTVEGDTLLPLPNAYIVPGGRFREIYYWDSYFTMLGLKESGEIEMIEKMIANFAFLSDEYGHIPNGNRNYFLSRSQPPFFSLMLDVLASVKGEQIYIEYLSTLEKEHDYWMDKTAPTKHTVKMPDGSLLNRYYDCDATPRQESFKEDYELADKSKSANKEKLFRDLRSGAESGWDFSSRWFGDGETLATIQTTDYVSVDLNSLLYHLEKTLAQANQASGNLAKAEYYNEAATLRKKAINQYCWSTVNNWYVDYNSAAQAQSPELTLAGMFPFFLNVAETTKIKLAASVLEQKFLKPGGLVTTLKVTGQQWDAPNGWAPLIWISVAGLKNYQQTQLAEEIASRWIKLNARVFKDTGKLMEKYNVIDTQLEAGGGEYPSQDGFGWTNGVLIALIKQYGF